MAPTTNRNRIDVTGHHAIVTGGGAGLGYAIAERLLESGAEVAIWDIDQKALDVAAEVQRQTHIRYQRYRWLPGWVDKATYDTDKPNGSGTVYVTLFGGMDPSLYEEIGASRTARIAVAQPTLRTWRKDQDAQGGPVLEVKKLPQPPLGSSGMQIRVQVRHVLCVDLNSRRRCRPRVPPAADQRLHPDVDVGAIEGRDAGVDIAIGIAQRRVHVDRAVAAGKLPAALEHTRDVVAGRERNTRHRSFLGGSGTTVTS